MEFSNDHRHFYEQKLSELVESSPVVSIEKKKHILARISNLSFCQLHKMIALFEKEQRELESYAHNSKIGDWCKEQRLAWQNSLAEETDQARKKRLEKLLARWSQYEAGILVAAEEDKRLHQAFHAVAQKKNYYVDYLTSPALLLKKIDEEMFDLVVLQDSFAHSTRESLLEKIKHQFPQMPVVVIGNECTPQALSRVVNCIRKGATHYVLKKFLQPPVIERGLAKWLGNPSSAKVSDSYLKQLQKHWQTQRLPYFRTIASDTTRVLWGYRLESITNNTECHNDYARLLDGLLHLNHVALDWRINASYDPQGNRKVCLYLVCAAEFESAPEADNLVSLHREIFCALSLFLRGCTFEILGKEELHTLLGSPNVRSGVTYHRQFTSTTTPEGVSVPEPWLAVDKWQYMLALIERLLVCDGTYSFSLRFAPIGYEAEFAIGEALRSILAFLEKESAEIFKIVPCGDYLEHRREEGKDQVRLQKNHLENMLRSLDRLYRIEISLVSDTSLREKEINLVAGELTAGYKSLLEVRHYRTEQELQTLRRKFSEIRLPEEETSSQNIRELITPGELCSYIALPSVEKQISAIQVNLSAQLPPPTNLSQEGVVVGMANQNARHIPIFIAPQDRNKHTYLIGKTGTGKSTLQQNMFLQDIYRGDGAALIDPLGDLAESLLARIPHHRLADVVYFNPTAEKPLGLSLFSADGPLEQSYIIGEFISIMIEIFGEEIFGPRIQDYTRGFLMTLFAARDVLNYSPSLPDLLRLLNYDHFDKIVNKIRSKAPERYEELVTFIDLIERQGTREGREILPYFRAKFSPLIETRLARSVFCQRQPRLDFNEILQGKKIFIANLSKGLVSEYNANLMGMLLIAKIKAAYLRRIHLPSEQRQPFHLYIDEFHNFCSTSFASMLAESRQYGVTITLANQFLSQLDFRRWGMQSKTIDSLLGNVGNLIAFRIGIKDAHILQGEFGKQLNTGELTGLKNWTAITKLLVNGQTTPPFTMRTLPLAVSENPNAARWIREHSSLQYGFNRASETKSSNFDKWLKEIG